MFAEPALKLHAADAPPAAEPVRPPDPLAELLDLLRERLLPPVGLIDRDQFAALLRVGVSTFDRLRASGQVGPTAVRFGGIKFEVQEVRAWFSARTSAGELYDAATWPPVWQAMSRGHGRSAPAR